MIKSVVTQLEMEGPKRAYLRVQSQNRYEISLSKYLGTREVSI